MNKVDSTSNANKRSNEGAKSSNPRVHSEARKARSAYSNIIGDVGTVAVIVGRDLAKRVQVYIQEKRSGYQPVN